MAGIYLHLPFCRVHCTYCPFAISTDLSLQDAYTAALEREIEARAAELDAPERRITSVYLGGGTPSRTSVANLERVFTAVRRAFDVSESAEISMEANPEDVSPASLDSWVALGVNRVSIGVQSFHDAELAAIGRVHDRSAAIEAVRSAAGRNVRTNLDLILGLPQQTRQSFVETLETAVGLGAGHLSLYMLDLEERTPLEVQVRRGRVSLPDDDFVADAYLDAVARLASAGLRQYEISNFALDGEICLHNLAYWTRGAYYGFGIAAHSFRENLRYANTRDIRKYIGSSPDTRDFSEQLGPDERRREEIFLGLRQVSGLDYEHFKRLCGQEGIEWIDRGLSEGWLRREGGRVGFTPSGFLQSNDYISQLF